MKKQITLLIISFIFLATSLIPMFHMIREFWIGKIIESRYEIHHAYEEQGFEDIIDVQEITVNGENIKIREEKTGRKASLTLWDKDANVPPGDIVKIHWLLNNKQISKPDEIWLSNRNRGSRYFSWLDVLTVKDRLTGNEQIKIVQRLTDDDELMDNRKWKIITISSDNTVKEEEVSYMERSENKLAVKLINLSGTSLMAMGYYSDITKGYPSVIFPIVYPVLTSLVGFVLLLIVLRISIKQRKEYNITGSYLLSGKGYPM
ncbi:hypothetical protein ACLIBG_00455 [Virgibacillus sp. W0181]|uniref:hypothetical protein n=1 Tax=Virgibacillus sp. W0181 TaxID=3391581 RepID=UPI003F47A3EA